ncbi:hypothetical protein P872_14795 [Rhodonellum psychrophilum GCM71 = DSM 17998]|uniref:Uncharacterized protein n=1 Tax=Rhodonellum psychrophilum GCM71 = DSM 17998 TaxID=1123057 RepID=U5C5V0_9BACT|nr:hypothetical protein P872_14795 [Rhodonellum psychrophilum GCM71 = DSM 17998]
MDVGFFFSKWPARPYLIGITILGLSFAWYQNLNPSRKLFSQEEFHSDCVE